MITRRSGLIGLTAATALFAIGRPARAANSIRLATTVGPHAQIVDAAKKVAERDGLKVEVIEFSDFIQPNAALAQGEVDINSYQHKPFLDQQIKDRGYKIEGIAWTCLFPNAIYSKKIKTLAEIKDGDAIAISNDPTNGARILFLLQKAGFIKLRPDAGLSAGVIDIVDNPRKLKIVELEAAQVPKALDDVTAAGITSTYAIHAGLNPVRDGLIVEATDTPYTCLIAARTADKDRPEFAKFAAAYRSPEVREFVIKTFDQAVIPSW